MATSRTVAELKVWLVWSDVSCQNARKRLELYLLGTILLQCNILLSKTIKALKT